MNVVLIAAIGLAAAVASAQTTSTDKTTEPTHSCCAKASDGTMKCDKPAAKADGANHDGHKMQCSLTGKVVDSCCCVEREGKMHCTLADKDVDACSCKPVGDEKSESAKSN